jgi:hypothetical protein
MMNWNTFMVAQERYADMVREAERERQRRALPVSRRSPLPRWLGRLIRRPRQLAAQPIQVVSAALQCEESAVRSRLAP